MTEYLTVIENENGNWGAYCPDLPGLGVAGSSRNEVERLIREAVPMHVAALKEQGEQVPPPTTTADYISASD